MSQASPTPEIVVTHVTSKDDFHALLQVEEAAFGPSPVMEILFPPSSSSAKSTKETGPSPQSVLNHQKIWATDPTAHYLKASLPDGKIIGMAVWHFLLDGTEPMRLWDMEMPPNTNREFADYFFGGANRTRKVAMAGKRHFLMLVLCVNPEYQRMGVGGKLLEWGLAEADREGVECWIDASPFGLGLYKKHGWKEVGYLDADLTKWGLEEGTPLHRMVHLVRQPKSSKVS